MKSISIISASIRNGRNSHRVSLYLKKFLEEKHQLTVSIIDLKELDFPLFEERLKLIESPTSAMLALADEITKADGIIVVTPEYNGGYPASLKNVIDLLYAEWKRKPIGIATVSAGAFGGSQVITSLQFSLWKIGALVVPAMFPVATVEKTFDEHGKPSDEVSTDKKATAFINELIWWIDAKQKMEG
ncbi:NADPH-dependent FMN reductase [Pedobacter namyangjuensis]|uniref:NADPH-dependent FMN reductase n=1 Tax=Pedobacter namyangjuensis TaxID=600626 RepID=UPI000DE51E0F|nr:NAD(P)H-dependent oxidoreductase [Pedobacter namyangjuensis]